MSRRILVTGATGTVGGALIRGLSTRDADRSIQVVAASRRVDRRERLAAKGVEAVPLDLDDAESIRTAVRGVDAVFLATGYTVDMLVQSKRFLDEAREAGVRCIVHLGAAGSDDQYYGHFVWHAYVERYIEALGFTYTHLQPRTFMSNVLAVVRPGVPVLRQYFADAPIAWIDPDDIAAVAAAALIRPEAHAGQTYRLAAEVLTMQEVTRIVSDATAVPFTYEARDPADLLGVLLKVGMEPVYARELALGIAAASRGEVPRLHEVDDTIERVTGRPRSRWADFATRNRDRFRIAAAPRA